MKTEIKPRQVRNIEVISNKTQELTRNSTDKQYPSAVAVYKNVIDRAKPKEYHVETIADRTMVSCFFTYKDRFIRCSLSGNIHYSTDGINYIQADTPNFSGFFSDRNHFTFNDNDIFIAVSLNGNDMRIIVSHDKGETWEFYTTTEGFYVGIAASENILIAYNGTNIISTSDGINWTQYNLPLQRISFVSYFKNNFVLLDSFGNVAHSTDLINWVKCNYFSGNTIFEHIYSFEDVLFITATDGESETVMVRTKDLRSWENLEAPPSTLYGVQIIKSSNTLYLAELYNPTIRASIDNGSTWDIVIPFPYGAYWIAFTNGIFAFSSFNGQNGIIKRKGLTDSEGIEIFIEGGEPLGFIPENVANKTGSINSQSTEIQYPNAAAVHAALEILRTSISGKQNALGFMPENIANKVQQLQYGATQNQYPSAAAVRAMYLELINHIDEFAARIVIPTYNTSDIEVYLEPHSFNSWQEIVLEGDEQYREVRFYNPYEGFEVIHKITNNTNDTVYLSFDDGNPLCIDRGIYENGLEIEPYASAEISWILANDIIEVMAVANRINI